MSAGGLRRTLPPGRRGDQASTVRTFETSTSTDLIDRLADVEPIRAAALGVADRAVVVGGRGPILAVDWASTRLIEIVIHSDDLSRSLPDRPPVPLTAPALAGAVRTLAQILAAREPGRSVELRVPPFAAVQAIGRPTAHPRNPAERRRDRCRDLAACRHRPHYVRCRPRRRAFEPAAAVARPHALPAAVELTLAAERAPAPQVG